MALYINGELSLFDSEQAKGARRVELDRFPVMRGSTVFDYAREIKVSPEINKLYFLHNGVGDLNLSVENKIIKSTNEQADVLIACCWILKWDAIGISGEITVYGN